MMEYTDDEEGEEFTEAEAHKLVEEAPEVVTRDGTSGSSGREDSNHLAEGRGQLQEIAEESQRGRGV